MDKIIQSIVIHASEEFNYGTLDCAIFAGEVINDIHGIDIVNKFKEEYDGIKGSIDWLQKNGYSDLIDAVNKELNITPVAVEKLKDGDLIAGKSKYHDRKKELSYTLGIYNKGYAFFIREEGNSIRKAAAEDCECGWNL